MPKRHHWLYLIEAIIGVGTVAAQAQQQYDDAGAAVNSICKEARYNRLLAEIIRSSRDDSLSQLDALAKAELSYRIAAAKNGGTPKQTAFTALAAVAAARRTRHASQLTAALPHSNLAYRLLKQREDRLTGIVRTSATKATGTTASYSSGGGGPTFNSAHTCTYSPTLDADGDADCTLDAATENTITTSKISLAKATQLPLVAEANLGRQKVTVTAYGLGSANSYNAASTTTLGLCVTSPGSGAVSTKTDILGALLTITKRTETPTATPLHDAANPAACTKSKIGEPWGEALPATIAHAVCMHKSNPFPRSDLPHTEELATLEASDELVEALTDLTNPGGKIPKDSGAKKTLVNKYFGSTPAGYRSDIQEEITTKKIEVTIRDTKIDKPPFELAVTKEGITALSYYIGKDLAEKKQTQDAADKPTVTKDQNDKCKAIKDKEKCKTEVGCKYNDKNSKCEEDPAKTTAATPNTNTTGNNSFVISKAPLLLAFLLF
uniref:Variant surface glycoprotein n=1 Tax=Trypanosoma brucei TaxID=5691 RepID=A0A1V0FZ58_9TRYP|nr:variant surface glycoprotein [Trypanosoma brucei]